MGLRSRRDDAVPALWGFAEATIFVIVPDVWLTWVAFEKGRAAALRAAALAVAGAVVGGGLVYWLAAQDHARVTAVIAALPGISSALIERVGSEFQERGALATVLGAFQGIPYKIYAAQAAAGGLGFVGFVLMSVPARALRFALVALLASGIAVLLKGRPVGLRRGLLVAFWVVFYALYFYLMG